MSKQQTAVEWLVEQLLIFGDKAFNKEITLGEYHIKKNEVIQQAKEMEKQQIIDAYNKSFELRDKPYPTADKYYTSTHGSKESDDHIGDANEMVASVQKLIDKDIFNQAILAMEEMYGSGCDEEIDAYFRGAKWMQQELNKQV